MGAFGSPRERAEDEPVAAGGDSTAPRAALRRWLSHARGVFAAGSILVAVFASLATGAESDAPLDLVIHGGRVIDPASGLDAVRTLGVRDGQIVALARGPLPSARQIDATGRIVTPGFVDIHTHYDGQVTWDDLLEPSSGHGVTTIVTFMIIFCTAAGTQKW